MIRLDVRGKAALIGSPVSLQYKQSAIPFTYANSFHYLGQLMSHLVAIVKKKNIGFGRIQGLLLDNFLPSGLCFFDFG